MSNGNGNGNGNGGSKDVVYLDIDEEITGVIDKVRGSDSKIVALVLPKRATAFQSIVNMRLLKRTADNAKKHVVLISADPNILPLAGAIGMHVAKNLQSRPEIPPAPANPNSADDEKEEAVDMRQEGGTPESPLNRSRSVGALADQAASQKGDDDAIELDNTDMTPPSSPADRKKSPKGKKNKKLKVPNFNRFRMLLIIGGIALVLLILLLYLCLAVLPKATITVKTDSKAIDSSLDLTLSPDATSTNVDAGVVPAVSEQVQKTLTQQVDATGERNDGTKASGSVTMTAGPCSGDIPDPVPAGTGISANGQTFLTQGTVRFVPDVEGSKCTFRSTNSTDVVAQKEGAAGNVGATSFSVAGHKGVTAKSKQPMSGGTDKITKIVSQGDIDNAKQKINSQDTSSVKQELQSALRSKGVFPVTATLSPGAADTTATANVGDAADKVTVTQKVTYTMLGAKQSDLKKIVANSVNKQIDPKKQTILDYGINDAIFKMQNQRAGGNTLVAMQVTSVAGSALDTDALKKQVAGKKAATAKSIIKSNPSVTDVDVQYSPFWVSSIPKSTGKITIEIEKPKSDNAKP